MQREETRWNRVKYPILRRKSIKGGKITETNLNAIHKKIVSKISYIMCVNIPSKYERFNIPIKRQRLLEHLEIKDKTYLLYTRNLL